VRALLAAQDGGGGWSWARGGAPDSNDTAAALQALLAAGVSGRPVERGLAALRSFQAPGGGFALTRGRPPDAQSTAWAIQALLAAGRSVPSAARSFLARLRRPDGSYRYSESSAPTPVWVTAQVVPALAGRPLGAAS
jgi:prenyltransferase beta subunit